MSKKKKIALPKKVEEEKKPRVKLPDKFGITFDIPFDFIQGKSLFLATPMYGGMCTGKFCQSVQSLTEICKEFGIPLNIHYLFNESLIQRGRNYCADEFIRARIGPEPQKPLDAEGNPLKDENGNEIVPVDNRPFFTHMLFIDSDIGFHPKDILLMLAMANPGDDHDVICGPYPKKCIAWEKIKVAVDKGYGDDPQQLERFVGDYVFNPKPIFNEKGEQLGFPLDRPVEILEGGTGFMMIQRQAFDKFRAKFPNQSYRPDHVRTKSFDGTREIYAYFDCVIDRGYTFDDVHMLLKHLSESDDLNKYKEEVQKLFELEKNASKRYLSEDYMFCQYLQKAGGKVWLVPYIKLEHVGSYIFGGSLIDLMQLGVSATANPEDLKNKK